MDWGKANLKYESITEKTAKKLTDSIKTLMLRKKDEYDRIIEELKATDPDLKNLINEFIKYINPMNKFYKLLSKNEDNTLQQRKYLLQKYNYDKTVECLANLRKK